MYSEHSRNNTLTCNRVQNTSYNSRRTIDVNCETPTAAKHVSRDFTSAKGTNCIILDFI